MALVLQYKLQTISALLALLKATQCCSSSVAMVISYHDLMQSKLHCSASAQLLTTPRLLTPFWGVGWHRAFVLAVQATTCRTAPSLLMGPWTHKAWCVANHGEGRLHQLICQGNTPFFKGTNSFVLPNPLLLMGPWTHKVWCVANHDEGRLHVLICQVSTPLFQGTCSYVLLQSLAPDGPLDPQSLVCC
jgi:hypothetical protein